MHDYYFHLVLYFQTEKFFTPTFATTDTQETAFSFFHNQLLFLRMQRLELVRHIQPQHQFNMYKRYKCCTRIKVTKLQIDTKPTGKTLGDTNDNLRLQAREKKKVQVLELYKTTTQKSWQVSEYTP